MSLSPIYVVVDSISSWIYVWLYFIVSYFDFIVYFNFIVYVMMTYLDSRLIYVIFCISVV